MRSWQLQMAAQQRTTQNRCLDGVKSHYSAPVLVAAVAEVRGAEAEKRRDAAAVAASAQHDEHMSEQHPQ